MDPVIGLKGQQRTAQGNALGVMAAVATPCKGKSIILYLSATSRAMPSTDAFAPSGRFPNHRPPYLLIAPSFSCRVIAGNHYLLYTQGNNDLSAICGRFLKIFVLS